MLRAACAYINNGNVILLNTIHPFESAQLHEDNARKRYPAQRENLLYLLVHSETLKILR